MADDSAGGTTDDAVPAGSVDDGAPPQAGDRSHGSSPGPTTREQRSPGSPAPTTREGQSRNGDAPAPGFNPLLALPTVAERYEFHGRHASGGEATLYRVRRHGDASGPMLLLKVYRPEVELNEEALATIRAMTTGGSDDPHVVQLVEWGRDPHAEQWFEVQELVEGGTLADLVAAQPPGPDGVRRLGTGGTLLSRVIAQLHAGVKALHAAGLSHHDIKPTNILVRSGPPDIDLVLADFGVAAAIADSHFLSRREGTYAYFAPESMGAGQGGPARDYWALGMTIAEVAGGIHPIARALGSTSQPADPEVMAYLHDRHDIDVGAVPDARVRELCRGLLRYDTANRWNAVQLDAWLAGANPVVLPDRVAAGPVGFAFLNDAYPDRAALARAMAANWRATVGRLQQPDSPGREQFFNDLIGTFGSDRLEALESRLRSNHVPTDRAVVELLVALDPDDPPVVFRGKPVDRDSLVALAGAAGSGDTQAVGLLDELFRQRALEAFPGGDLAELDSQWRRAVESYGDLLRRGRDHFGGDDDHAWEVTSGDRVALLGAVADPTSTALSRKRDDVVRRAPECVHESWFDSVVGVQATDPARILAGIRFADSAAGAVRIGREQRSAAARARLRDLVDPVRRWLLVTFWVNLLLGLAGVGGLIARQVYADEIAADPALAEGLTAADVLYWLAPLWLVAAAVSLGARWWAGRAEQLWWVRVGLALAILTTLTVPFLVPIGIGVAYHVRWKRLAPVESRLRLWGGLGAVAGVATVGIVWWDADASTFLAAFDRWPYGVQEWWIDNWPGLVDPSSVAANTPMLQYLAGAIAVIALMGVWWGYADDWLGPRLMTSVGLLGGVLAVALLAPYVATVIGVAAYVALIVGAVVAALLVVGSIWAFCSD